MQITHFVRYVAAAVVAAFHCATPAAAAELTGTHSDWKTYRHGGGKNVMCFAVTSATEQNPTGGGRQAPHFYITAWPKQGIKAEVSVLLGFDLQPKSSIKVEIGGSTFTLFADGDRAFVGQAGEEQRLISAMRRGARMVVEATSARGATSKDVYSLSGVTASMQALRSCS
ncbi:MAG: invasion associated locus B family protein [Hyphomicrobiaceae bacterium]